MNRTTKKIFIALLLFLISYLHYSTQAHSPVVHILHRELYLIPILFGAYWFGKKGGLIVAVISSIIFLPKVLSAERISSASGLNNLFEILTFMVVAYLLGHFQDVRHSHWRTFFKPAHPEPGQLRPKPGGKVLVCIDNSPQAGKAAQYVVDTFLKHDETTVTVLEFIRALSGDVFKNAEEYEMARAENERIVADHVNEAHRILVEGGFSENAITIRTVRIHGESLADKIIEEQRQLSCDTVVLAGAKMSKTEEFILGNTAVKLVREANFSVVTVF